MNQLNRKEEMIHKLTKRTMQGGDDWCMDIDKWDWNPGVGLYGIVCAYEKIKKYEYLSFLTEWVEKNWRLKEENHTINSTAPFITVAELFRITGEQKYLDSCICCDII